MESIRAFGSKFFSLRVDLILEGGGVAGGGGGGGGAKMTRHRKLFNPLALENKH